jgi:predicted HicB family RNase H-like nuclease
LLNIRDVVLFEGITVTGLKIAFKNAVEDYIDVCKRLGK